MNGFGERVAARLDRLGLDPVAAARAAALPLDSVARVIEGTAPPPRGRALLRLAEVLSTTAAYLVGLDPDEALPAEWGREDQGELGLLSADEEALLRAYRRMDPSLRAALLVLAGRVSPEPEKDERPPQVRRPAAATKERKRLEGAAE